MKILDNQLRSIALNVERDGFAVVDDVLRDSEVETLICAFESACDLAQRTQARAEYAFRDVFRCVPETIWLAQHPVIAELVLGCLGRGAFGVRALFFDKVSTGNWLVGWHQDQAIAITQRPTRDQTQPDGFGPYSNKNGVPHTKASPAVLNQMLAVRVHLDDCGLDNGPLRCLPGSHQLGSLSNSETLALREKHGEVTCTVKSGGVVLMKPLCLHASSPADAPTHRRVVHIEYSTAELPHPLEWYERIKLNNA